MDSESRQIFWDGYLAARREHFLKEQQVLLGNEFRSNPTFWLEVAEKEWAVVCRWWSGQPTSDNCFAKV